MVNNVSTYDLQFIQSGEGVGNGQYVSCNLCAITYNVILYQTEGASIAGGDEMYIVSSLCDFWDDSSGFWLSIFTIVCFGL